MNYRRPEGFGSMPPVVKNLLIINVIVFVVTSFLPPMRNVNLQELLSLHYFTSDKFRPHQLVTYMFMHGSIMHIFMNMIAVWMFGRVLESVWGSKRFLTYYLITGIGAALVHMGYNYFQFWKLEQAVTAFAQSPEPGEFMLTLRQHFDGWFNVEKATELYEAWRANPGSPELASNAVSGLQEVYNARVKMEADIPTVGASGSVFGLLLAFGMLFPNTELMLLFFPVPIKAKYFVILYAALELYLGIQNNPGDNIAHFAHLGGALFGFVLVKLWSRDRRNFY